MLTTTLPSLTLTPTEQIEIRMRFLRARLAAITTAAELTPIDWSTPL